MSALVTSDQLYSAISKVKTYIKSMFGYTVNALFGSIDINGLTITHDTQGDSLAVTDQETDRTVLIPMPEYPGTRRAVTVDEEDNEIFADGVITDYISDGTMYYSLPNSSNTANGRSLDPEEGGGTILTTKFRSIPLLYHSSVVGSEIMSLFSDYYHKITNRSNVTVILLPPPQGVAQYWIDITFRSGMGSFVKFLDENSEPKQLIYIDEEPDTTVLAGKRIIYHILDDVVTYQII